jgi:transcriptional regulator with XRE-family HTH domain
MQSIGKAIKEIIKAKGISLNRMARDLGIAPESLFRSLQEDANPEWKRIRQILDYLNYDILLKPKRKRINSEKPNLSSSKQQEGEQNGDKKIWR